MKAILGMILHRQVILPTVWSLFFTLPVKALHDTLFLRSTG